MITLMDLGQEFWRESFGGAKAMLGYEAVLEKIDWYRRECPRFIVCCDSPRSVRKEKHETYKANRKEKPQDAIEALGGIIQRATDWGVPVVMVDGWEADDVIATLTRQAWPEEVQILGTEKDFYCLIDDERVCLVGKNGPITSADCEHKFGVSPSQMLDWLALVGDASDGVAGCEGWGPAKATALLRKFGSILWALRANDEDITGIEGAKIGPKTLASFRAWDPGKAVELITMNDRLPIDLYEILERKYDLGKRRTDQRASFMPA
jgi:DNA polymerase-1